MQIWFADHVIIAEVKNIIGNTIKDAELMQVDRRMSQILNYPEFKGLVLKGLTIVNQERNTPFLERKNLQLAKNQIPMLTNRNTGAITVETLLKAFIWIKNDKLSLEVFDKMLHQNGLIEFKKEQKA